MQKTFPMSMPLNTLSREEITRLIEAVPLSRGQLSRELGCHLSTLYRWENGKSIPKLPAIKLLRQLAQIGNRNSRSGAKFTFVDLFAGIGGMRLGVEDAGGRCIFSCEWDRYARITYQENFQDGPDHPYAMNVWEVPVETIPKHDFLVAGFPCQPFSIAGVSKKNALGRPHGFDDQEQGNLFFRIAEILDYHRPPAFLLENVKNLKTHDKGRTFGTIMKILCDDLGYKVQTRIVDAAGFVPQHRERIFIAGFREGSGFDFTKLRIPDAKSGPRLGSILHPEDGGEPEEPPFTLGPEGQVAEKYILSNHLWSYLKKYAAKHRAMGNGFGYGLVRMDDIARTLSARYYKDGSEILIDRGKGKSPRRLTPRECARLMGFDRPGKPFQIPVSDTRAYKQFGNAVVVPVVQTIAKFMAPHILESMRGRQLELGLAMAANG